ncbi:MAG: HEPN domain-containing protein [Magnetococcales bacterium]|nr:HEPN domain-containing protein [Magnetococcales bacterium]
MSADEHALSLLALANDDLKASRVMARQVEDFSDAIFGFHIQQTVEKALKAWLAALGVVYPKTHELHRLLIILTENGAAMDRFQWVEGFNPFAVQCRYESSQWDEPLDRNLSVLWAEQLLGHVTKQVNGMAMSGARSGGT